MRRRSAASSRRCGARWPRPRAPCSPARRVVARAGRAVQPAGRRHRRRGADARRTRRDPRAGPVAAGAGARSRPIRRPGNPAGIALGEALVPQPAAVAHRPALRELPRAVAPLRRRPRRARKACAAGSRNTPSLLDAARHRRYGWDGAHDQLWAQSLRPLEDAREMPASAAQVAALVRGDAALSARFAARLRRAARRRRRARHARGRPRAGRLRRDAGDAARALRRLARPPRRGRRRAEPAASDAFPRRRPPRPAPVRRPRRLRGLPRRPDA